MSTKQIWILTQANDDHDKFVGVLGVYNSLDEVKQAARAELLADFDPDDPEEAEDDPIFDLNWTEDKSRGQSAGRWEAVNDEFDYWYAIELVVLP